MNFCSQCGGVVSIRTPDGDTLPRHVCDGCGHIHYSNPKLVVGCIAEWEEKILLCRRAIEPRLGLWTIPAGFMENLETSEQAAARETLETPDHGPGHESLESALVDPAEIPWDELAFPVIEETLRRYLDDRARGQFTLHTGVLVRRLA